MAQEWTIVGMTYLFLGAECIKVIGEVKQCLYSVWQIIAVVKFSTFGYCKAKLISWVLFASDYLCCFSGQL